MGDRRVRTWTRAVDLLAVLLVPTAASVAVGGGIRASLWGHTLSITSAPRLLFWAAVLILVRHVLWPAPSLPARARSIVTRPRAMAFCVVAALAVYAAGVVSARSLQERLGLSEPEIRQRMFDELQPTELADCRFERFGEPNDGGYLLCGNLLKAAKTAYSYGISGYDQWGCDVSVRLGVPVHEYDCFDPQRPSCPSGTLVFHDECVAGRQHVENGRLFDTLRNQFLKNGDEARAVVMKIDVEGAEWDSFLQAPDATLDRIDQIAVEFHGIDARSLAVIRKLKKSFYVAHLHFNNMACQHGLEPFPSWAYEALLVSKRLANPPAASAARFFGRLRDALWLRHREPLGSPLDARNDPGRPDCQPAR